MNTTELTDKKQIFDKMYIGDFDTRKNLNRSTKKICPEFINDLENEIVTSEGIKTLSKSLPIFIYKTCITIHGTTTTQMQRIGDYKNVILNQNGSIEIRYNAIDLDKKRFLAEVCEGWKYSRSSAEDYLYKNIAYTTDKEEAQRLYNETKEIWKDKKIKGVKAQIYFVAYNVWGKILVQLIFKPLLIEGDIKSIAGELEGVTVQEIESRIKANQDQKEANDKERAEDDKKRQEAKANDQEAKEKLMQEINHLKTPQTFEPNKTYIQARVYRGINYFLFLQTGDKKAFGNMNLKTGKSESVNLPKEFTDRKTIKAKGDHLQIYKPQEFKIYQ